MDKNMGKLSLNLPPIYKGTDEMKRTGKEEGRQCFSNEVLD
jgi:hypothetical protein